jgi:hypothetical protein
MKKSWILKFVSATVILLFIGVAVAPSINSTIVKASTDNDLVEVTSQACGIQGFGNTTVKLTRQQYQNLEQYLVDFRARLNQTTTKEEAIPPFKEAVVELNTYGLLPKGMSVTQAQKLIIGASPETSGRRYRLIEKNNDSHGENENFCCLLVGSLTHTLSHGPLNNMLNRIIWILDAWYQRHPTAFMEGILNLLLMGLLLDMYASMMFSFIVPLHLFVTIGVGWTDFGLFIPATGTLWTIGLNGIKQWSGDMSGSLPLVQRVPFPFEDYPGIFGFTGFRISEFFTNNDTVLYLGSALWVNITSESAS